VCADIAHLCEKILHLCGGIAHLCKEILHLCAGIAHLCGEILHLRKIIPHLWSDLFLLFLNNFQKKYKKNLTKGVFNQYLIKKTLPDSYREGFLEILRKSRIISFRPSISSCIRIRLYL
jgi:hypothetical protein